ncbi:MAG: PA2778 family cysteine peptidase [Candidatus Omnitrophota bacterium]
MLRMFKKFLTGEQIVLLLIFLLLLSGCSLCRKTHPENYSQNFYIEDLKVLLNVPFIKQKESYCGPAALAAVFNYWCQDQKPDHSQEKIAERIFYPELCGVLNIDLEQYAKEQGFWAKGYSADFKQVKTRLKSGIPVIAIEKLHPYIFNKRHYVIIVGFDDEKKIIFQHDGKHAFNKRSYQGFLRNWYAAGNWMLEIIPLDKIPHDFKKEDYFELALWLEKNQQDDQAIQYYNQLVSFEASNEKKAEVFFNLGNIYLKQESYGKAEEIYLKALALDKNFADAYNNLAFVYLKQGNLDQAHNYVNKALEFQTAKQFYYLDTQAQIFWQENNIDAVLKILASIKSIKDQVNSEIWQNFCDFWQKKFLSINKSKLLFNNI